MDVTLNEECKERYHEVERKGLQYLVLFITDDGKEIRVDKTGELLNTCYLKTPERSLGCVKLPTVSKGRQEAGLMQHRGLPYSTFATTNLHGIYDQVPEARATRAS